MTGQQFLGVLEGVDHHHVPDQPAHRDHQPVRSSHQVGNGEHRAARDDGTGRAGEARCSGPSGRVGLALCRNPVRLVDGFGRYPARPLDPDGRVLSRGEHRSFLGTGARGLRNSLTGHSGGELRRVTPRPGRVREAREVRGGLRAGVDRPCAEQQGRPARVLGTQQPDRFGRRGGSGDRDRVGSRAERRSHRDFEAGGDGEQFGGRAEQAVQPVPGAEQGAAAVLATQSEGQRVVAGGESGPFSFGGGGGLARRGQRGFRFRRARPGPSGNARPVRGRPRPDRRPRP